MELIKKYKYILIPILFFLLYPPDAFWTRLPGSIKTPVRLLGCLIILVSYIAIVLRERQISKMILGYSVFFVYTFLNTVIKQGDIFSALYNMGVLAFAMLMFFEGFCREDRRRFYLLIYITMYVQILINLYTYIRMLPISTDAEIYCYFGNTNAWFNYYFPAIIVGYLLYEDKKDLRMLVSIVVVSAIALATSYKNRSATTLFIVALLIIYLLFFNRRIFEKLFNIVTYSIANAAIFFLIVFPGSTENSFKLLLSDIFNKTTTFSSRTPLWDRAKVLVGEHIITGYGAYTREEMTAAINIGGLNHFHNMYFTEIYLGGMIGFVLFLGLFAIVVYRLMKIKDYRIKGVLVCMIGLLFLRGQMESNIRILTMLIIALGFYADAFYEDSTNYINIDKILKRCRL